MEEQRLIYLPAVIQEVNCEAIEPVSKPGTLSPFLATCSPGVLHRGENQFGS